MTAIDNEARLKSAMYMLLSIINDAGVPRNIRRAATQALNQLRDEKLTPGVKAANAVSILDSISQDPNMPVGTRTKIWQVIAILETIRD